MGSMHHDFLTLQLKNFPRDLNQKIKLTLVLTVCLTFSGCLVYRPEDHSSSGAATVNIAERVSKAMAERTQSKQALQPPPVLKSSDLKNVETMLLQRDRATPPQKTLALELIEDGKRLATEATAQGLRNERSGLSKLFCDSAIEYPTVDGLMSCAEAIALADVGLDVKIKQFDKAAGIYRTIPDFAQAINEPLSPKKAETIEENIVCLEQFIWSLDTEATSCQIIQDALR